ncbi:hypothetical protein PFICI_13199 [Pestalotiopsis fici W106-1]|uniref:AttH domain-containing protein n=1 Tax=Pestalotiopsis fici (strain W106-1 / CGMCC3.15140) TaxID=1229662 RepID=W3WLD8_PESFW|nr:uncharacterized protein PFICI_13199 [Pestalotiopsis fici W106-1]ETS74715.1 hypothetical protein PFICI_13199 [Pestalotiopsis fici W106-1]
MPFYKLTALAVLALTRCALAYSEPRAYVIPSGQFDGTARADEVVDKAAFDGPQVTVNNGSAYQWWYFDAVAQDSNATLVAQFYPGWFSESNAVLLNIVWPNGTSYANVIPVGDLQLTTIGEGSQGYVDSGSMSWFGASDLSVYHLTLDLPEAGVSGKITMRSRAPAHVACGLRLPGASFEFAPYLYWANAVPDSYASVDLLVNGTELSFSGSGYHDQNWGTAPFASDLTQWYWGHSSIGNYSLVYFYHIDAELSVTASAYLSENGEPIIASCASSVIEVAPQGANVTVPLALGTDVERWLISISDPIRGDFNFTVENMVMAADQEIYTRWVTKTTGGCIGCDSQTGTGIIEWMNNPTLALTADA